jgi:hypothetical protein
MTDPATLDDLQALSDDLDLAGDPSAARLASPRVEVTLDDGRVLTTQVRNPDFLRWDRTAAKHGWPDFRKAPILWLTFVAWSALRREGQIPDALTWEEFGDRRALEVRNVPPETQNGSGPGDPTPPGAEPG